MEEEEGAGVRKRKRDGEAGGVVVSEEVGCGHGGGKELGEDEEEYEGISEESVEEVMRWLETEISLPAPSPAPDKDAAFGFVTINGNEESCGPSFSSAETTVMASVDTRAGAPAEPPTAVPWPWPSTAPEADAARGEDDEQEAMVAADVGEVDEEWAWLVELLTGGPALEV